MILSCKNKAIVFLLCATSFLKIVSAQTVETDSLPSINNTRLIISSATIATGYTTAIILLDQAWYKNYPRSSFHFHNDNADWLQIDKMGHSISSYYLSILSYKTFSWAGLDNKSATLWGSLSGWAFISVIEVLDGFSAEWGASTGDIVANTFGTALFTTQQLTWEEQRIKLRYSYHKSGLEVYRPDLLGTNLAENMLKDYNGITSWLSFNINSFAGENSIIPPWLNIAVGYGASGMLGSISNPSEHNGQPLPYYKRTRHFYLSPDVDFGKIKTNSTFLKSVFSLFDFLKMPAPAIEYSKEYGLQFHLVFF
ncbi:MAG: DUF2279 domain-containing protein [Bacteroidetes bacterium]|nr:DUF2279 domain-containing protein [Bacteroidota bacterium]